MWRGNRHRLWLNYGFCPNCTHRHRPRVGPITCDKCGHVFDNRGLEPQLPTTPKGWIKTILGGLIIALLLLVFTLAADGLPVFLADL